MSLRSQILLLGAYVAVALAAVACNDDASCSAHVEDAQVDEIEGGNLYLLQTDVHMHNHARQAAAAVPKAQIDADGEVLSEEGDAKSLLQTDVKVEGAKAKGAATTTSYLPPKSSAEASGVKTNAAGDLTVFLTALVSNVVMGAGCVACFMVLREWYPLTYQNNLKLNTQLKEIPEGVFGWVKASWRATTPQVMEDVGLDQAMLLQFMQLGMKIMAFVGIPMLTVMGPMNCMYGGKAAGEDHLSYLSFGNVENGSNLYWIHAFVVWAVVFIVQTSVYQAQKEFLPYRFQWLQEQPNPRGNTILVEGIPEAYQSDTDLKTFFNKLFAGGDKVSSSYVVRAAPELEALYAKVEMLKQAIEKAKFKAQKTEATPEDKEYAIQLTDELKQMEKEVVVEQTKVKSMEHQKGAAGYYTSTGFVSFKSRADTALALQMQIAEDADAWELSLPPVPSAVIWRDLQQGAKTRGAFTLFGYALTAGLFMVYLPSVIGITQVAVKINMGPLQPLWAGFAPTMGLQFMVAFLPTFLIMIFRFCFTLKDDAWAQQTLQNWYFIFQVVFVILVTAIGGSMVEFLDTLVEKPLQIFDLLGKTMPSATHFYMNFLVLQWTSHSMVLMRYIPLTKWFMFRRFYDDETARTMSEPEDQDYYGIGSRSCRMTINLCIGIIYGTLSPPINLLTFIEFLICRVTYGYLLPFAETKKADLGGVFWVQQLRHIFTGNIIYCMVMTGVLLGRATTNGPGVIAGASLFYVVWSMQKFERSFSWEKIPFTNLMDGSIEKPKPDCGTYVQPFMQ